MQVTCDANGNITGYDPDGSAGPIPSRSIAYDLENRPVSIRITVTVRLTPLFDLLDCSAVGRMKPSPFPNGFFVGLQDLLVAA